MNVRLSRPCPLATTYAANTSFATTVSTCSNPRSFLVVLNRRNTVIMWPHQFPAVPISPNVKRYVVVCIAALVDALLKLQNAYY